MVYYSNVGEARACHPDRLIEWFERKICRMAQGGSEEAELAQAVERQSAKVLHWRLVMNIALMIFDMLVYFCTGLLVFFVTKEVDIVSSRFEMNLAVNPYLYVGVCSIIWVFCAHVVGVYHRHVFADGYQLNMLLLKAMFVCWIAVCALNFIIKSTVSFYSVSITCLVVWIVEMIARYLARKFLTVRHRKGEYAYPTVIVGSPEGIGQILKFLKPHRQLNYKPIRVCPIRLNANTGLVEANPDIALMRKEIKECWGAPISIIEYSDTLAERAAKIGAQTVMVTDVLDRFSDNLNTFALQMESINLEIALITSALDIAEHATQMRNIQGMSIMTISLPQYTPAAKIKKRIFDLVVSTIAIICSSWLMLIVAIAIKLEDGGPVFYKQERIGLRGKPFYIHKFRSMRVDADAHLKEVLEANGQEMGARYKLTHDPRITKVGNFIRKTSLDELPQFFDVFMGSMSVVGPRPQRDFEVEEYDPVYATRLLVKPGITGPWQVSGRSDLNEEESRQLDVSYVQDWSVLGDIVYILRTVGTVLHPSGAY